MSAKSSWSLEQLEDIKNELNALPPQAKKFTKKEAVTHMKDAILKAKNNDQTIESIKEFFEKKGLKISQRELKEIFGISAKPKKMATKRSPSASQVSDEVNANAQQQV